LPPRRRRIAQAMRTLEWIRPSRVELGEGAPVSTVPLFDSADDAQLATEMPVPSVAGSSQRGVILHKLMEEVLTNLGRCARAASTCSGADRATRT
jgi:hypothetical protein